MENALLLVALAAAVVFAVLYLTARASIDRAAREQYERWREKDLARVVAEQRGVAKREALADLDLWRGEAAAEIRQDAIDRGRSVIVGQG